MTRPKDGKGKLTSRLRHHRPRVAYAPVPNDLARMLGLPLAAKGLYALMASHSDGWQFSIDSLAEPGTQGSGRSAVEQMMQKLLEAGWITRYKQRDGYMEYVVHETPVAPEDRTLPVLRGKPHAPVSGVSTHPGNRGDTHDSPDPVSAPDGTENRGVVEDQEEDQEKPSSVESPDDGLGAPVADGSPSPSGPEGALFDHGSQPATKPGKGGPHRDEATGLTDRFWEWHKTARGREPRLEGGAGQKSWLAIRGVFEALLDAGWTEAQVRAAAKDAKLISIASMTFTLGQIEDRAVKARAPSQRDAWMGSVSAGEVEAREAQEAFHRARLAAAGQPAAPPVQTPPAARAGRLRDPLRDRQPAPPTAPDPAA